jgi:hypothetical protein
MVLGMRVGGACLHALSSNDLARLPRSRPQPPPTFEFYGAISFPSHVWSSPLMTWPSSLLPKTAPSLSVSVWVGCSPWGYLGGWRDGATLAN